MGKLKAERLAVEYDEVLKDELKKYYVRFKSKPAKQAELTATAFYDTDKSAQEKAENVLASWQGQGGKSGGAQGQLQSGAKAYCIAWNIYGTCREYGKQCDKEHACPFCTSKADKAGPSGEPYAGGCAEDGGGRHARRRKRTAGDTAVAASWRQLASAVAGARLCTLARVGALINFIGAWGQRDRQPPGSVRGKFRLQPVWPSRHCPCAAAAIWGGGGTAQRPADMARAGLNLASRGGTGGGPCFLQQPSSYSPHFVRACARMAVPQHHEKSRTFQDTVLHQENEVKTKKQGVKIK